MTFGRGSMSSFDIGLAVYIGGMLLSLFISYKFGAGLIKETGSFVPQVLFSLLIHLCIGILAIIGWVMFAFSLNEFALIIGGLLGAGMIAAGWVILLVLFLVKRKQLMSVYENA